jgi:hypothetical protein
MLNKLLACCSSLSKTPLRLEKCGLSSLRGEQAHKTLTACLVTLLVICVICLPLPVTGTTPFGEAKNVWHERNVATLYEGEEREFDDLATRFLFPLHLFSSPATLVSLLNFLAGFSSVPIHPMMTKAWI